MYCSNCGKQIEDGVRFCKYCGTPTAHPETPAPRSAGELGTKQEHRTVQAAPVTDAESSSKSKVKKGFILPAVLVVAVVIVAGVFLVRSMSGSGIDSTDTGSAGNIGNAEPTASSAIIGSSYAIPELPDAFEINMYDGNDYFSYIIEGQTLVTTPVNCWDVKLAADGTLAMRINDGGRVLIYRNGVQIGEIPSPVEYFYLCGSGEKIVYGTSYDNTYLWDISAGESNLISDKYYSRGISYDGSMVDIGQYYSRNGREPTWMYFSYIRDMSPDGKFVYYGENYKSTSSDGVEQNYSVFCVMINGDKHELLSYSDPDYYPNVIAYSQNYREVLFSFKDDIYFFSTENVADMGFEAQHVGNIKNGQLLSLNMAVEYASIFSADSYSDAVSAWRSDCYYGGGSEPYRTQKALQNGTFCLLKEQNGVKSGSIVRLVDNGLIELIPNITGNICLSDDETKLWCVADGRLVFCDLAAESPHPVYCDIAYVRAYDASGAVGISGDMIYSEYGDYALTTVPIVTATDGKTAYFISADGSLWMCTPDTVREPQYITDNAFWVQRSSEDTIYLMKGDSWAYFNNGTFCDLYQVGSDGKVSYLYSNVVDMYMTKTDAYISVGGSSGNTSLYNAECALYCISGGGYKFICDGYSAGDVHGRWWGIRN